MKRTQNLKDSLLVMLYNNNVVSNVKPYIKDKEPGSGLH